MIKHTQTIHRQFAKELLSVWPFCGIGAQRVNAIDLTIVILRNFVLKRQNNTNNWVQLQWIRERKSTKNDLILIRSHTNSRKSKSVSERPSNYKTAQNSFDFKHWLTTMTAVHTFPDFSSTSGGKTEVLLFCIALQFLETLWNNVKKAFQKSCLKMKIN